MQSIVWSPGVSLDELEKAAIKLAFQFYGKNKTTTSNALGISIRTLDAKLERYEKEDAEHAKRMEAEKRRNAIYLARARGIPVEIEEPAQSEEVAVTTEADEVSVADEPETPRSVANGNKGKNSPANKRNG